MEFLGRRETDIRGQIHFIQEDKKWPQTIAAMCPLKNRWVTLQDSCWDSVCWALSCINGL